MAKKINEHTWQTELIAELEAVIKGFEEGREYEKEMLPKVKDLVKELKSGGIDNATHVAHQLIDLKLNWFASKLLGSHYHDQAGFKQKTDANEMSPAPLEIEHSND